MSFSHCTLHKRNKPYLLHKQRGWRLCGPSYFFVREAYLARGAPQSEHMKFESREISDRKRSEAIIGKVYYIFRQDINI